MRRVAVIVVAGCVMALAALPAVLTSSAPPGASQVTASGEPAAAPASADQLAVLVLNSAPIPPGAQLWTAPPPSILDWPPESQGVGGLTDVDALYLAGGISDRWVLARVPRGARETDSGTVFSPSGDVQDFTVSLPTSGPNEYSAQLVYSTTETAGGLLLRIDAQVVWVPDRSGTERIPVPAGAELTGYTTLSAANPSSGAVSVQLGEADSSRLATAVNALPLAPQVACAEDSLLFTITFEPPAFSSHPGYSVSEDLCGSTVYLIAGATRLPALSDTGCSLRRLVVSLLPAAATGTRSTSSYC